MNEELATCTLDMDLITNDFAYHQLLLFIQILSVENTK